MCRRYIAVYLNSYRILLMFKIFRDMYTGRDTLVYIWLVGGVLYSLPLKGLYLITIFINGNLPESENPISIYNEIFIDVLAYLLALYTVFICLSIINAVKQRKVIGFWKYFNSIIAIMLLFVTVLNTFEYAINNNCTKRIWNYIEQSIQLTQKSLPMKEANGMSVLERIETSRQNKTCTFKYELLDNSIPIHISRPSQELYKRACSHKLHRNMLSSVISEINLEYATSNGSHATIVLTPGICKPYI